MTENQWERLLALINGEKLDPLPTGFIIDSPWLPNWFGISIMDYLSSEELWFEANLKACETFKDTIFLPGFWSEFGMCTEPSAFGAKCSFPENEFPSPHKLIDEVEAIDRVGLPNPKTDGLLPFVVKRLRKMEPRMEEAGHIIKFGVSRGHLNIATFLMGTTDFLLAMKLNPERIHKLLSIITDFIKNWIDYQRECFSSIDGILILDDIVGFLGEGDFKEFVMPYMKKIYGESNVSVRFFHNDAPCKISAPYLSEIGINLFNMGIQSELHEVKVWTGNKVCLMGNIPPRDVLADGTPDEVKTAVEGLVNSLEDTSRILFSAGGGMPPGVSTENINAFINRVRGKH